MTMFGNIDNHSPVFKALFKKKGKVILQDN